MQKSDCIISVEHVSKFFGDKAVLNDVNLSVRKGEFVTILGPSGCGKTTLLRLIAGFQTASEGVITIAGKDITQTPPHRRPVNTVFQKYALFPHLNVFNNIAFGLKLKKLPAATIEKKVKQALRMVGMTDYEDRDMIISGITITPQRKEAVDFSYPYFAAHQLILTQKNLTVKSVADLKGKNVAVVANSAGDIACSKVFGKASSNIKRFDNTPLVLEELSAGGVDAAVGDIGVFAYYALQNPDKQFNMARDPSFEDQYFGIAFRKGNTELRDKVNEGLKKIIANGEYAKIYAKWFGDKAQPPKLPIPE